MKHFALALALLSAIALAGCANTIRGAGRDIGNAVDATGEAVEEVVR